MEKTDENLRVAAAIAGICIFGAGFMFGVPTWAEFPENYAYDIFAGTSTMLAAIATIAGAYFVATMQIRHGLHQKKQRLAFFVYDLFVEITALIEETRQGERPELRVIRIKEGIHALDNLPLDEIPGDCIVQFKKFIQTANSLVRHTHEAANLKCQGKDEIMNTQLGFSSFFLQVAFEDFKKAIGGRYLS